VSGRFRGRSELPKAACVAKRTPNVSSMRPTPKSKFLSLNQGLSASQALATAQRALTLNIHSEKMNPWFPTLWIADLWFWSGNNILKYLPKFTVFFVLAGMLWSCMAQSENTLTTEEVKDLYEVELKQFIVDEHVIHMNGYIVEETSDLLRQILRENPHITTVVMHDVPGSLDDEASLVEAARLVRKFTLNTHLPADATIASGGVVFFLAGVKRSAGAGAKLGVHSWNDGKGIEGADLPRDHTDHQLFLDYYREMHIPKDFYWFTLEAAPFEGIHWMSRRELEHYEVFTGPMLETSK